MGCATSRSELITSSPRNYYSRVWTDTKGYGIAARSSDDAIAFCEKLHDALTRTTETQNPFINSNPGCRFNVNLESDTDSSHSLQLSDDRKTIRALNSDGSTYAEYDIIDSLNCYIPLSGFTSTYTPTPFDNNESLDVYFVRTNQGIC